MRRIEISAFELAQRYIGTKEVPGGADNPTVMSWLKLDNSWPDHDEVPNCSAFVNYIAWLLRLPRSKSLAARSWLGVGEAIDVTVAEPGFDVVVFKRGADPQPGPEVLNAPGHVGWYAGREADNGRILVLGANQNDSVNVAPFVAFKVLGIRRLA